MHVRVAFLLPHLPSPRGHFSDPPPLSLSLSLGFFLVLSLRRVRVGVQSLRLYHPAR